MYRESLQNNAAQILLSNSWRPSDVTVPVEWNLEAAARQTPDIEALAQIYRELEFFSMLKELRAAGPSGNEAGFQQHHFSGRARCLSRAAGNRCTRVQS